MAKLRGCSLLNEVLGPVMRGPSSSHAAAPYAIARTCRELSLSNGEAITSAQVRFDPGGSFAQVYTGQGSDQGFAAGLLGLPVESAAYLEALPTLQAAGRPFDFAIDIQPLEQADHPNLVEVVLQLRTGEGPRLDHYRAVSTGGGTFQFRALNGAPIEANGATGVLIVECGVAVPSEALRREIAAGVLFEGEPATDELRRIHFFRTRRILTGPERSGLQALTFVQLVREALPRQLLQGQGRPLFLSAQEALRLADNRRIDDIGLEYEAAHLDLSRDEVLNHFRARLRRMLSAVETGLAEPAPSAGPGMKFLHPSARAVASSRTASHLAGDRLQRAIAGALAVMETNTRRGVVCAAPTAGSAGIVPGCLYDLDRAGHSEEEVTRALVVMAVVGSIIAIRATFAAELCGCMAETGAAAAMAAGGMVHIQGGDNAMVFDAASLCLMNTLGLICDPVQGEIEIPCHARNVAGVGHAYVAAASVLAGFRAVIPYDEVVDSMMEVGRRMSSDLRCTAKGGLAVTPTARALTREGRAGRIVDLLQR